MTSDIQKNAIYQFPISNSPHIQTNLQNIFDNRGNRSGQQYSCFSLNQIQSCLRPAQNMSPQRFINQNNSIILENNIEQVATNSLKDSSKKNTSIYKGIHQISQQGSEKRTWTEPNIYHIPKNLKFNDSQNSSSFSIKQKQINQNYTDYHVSTTNESNNATYSHQRVQTSHNFIKRASIDSNYRQELPDEKEIGKYNLQNVSLSSSSPLKFVRKQIQIANAYNLQLSQEKSENLHEQLSVNSLIVRRLNCRSITKMNEWDKMEYLKIYDRKQKKPFLNTLKQNIIQNNEENRNSTANQMNSQISTQKVLRNQTIQPEIQLGDKFRGQILWKEESKEIQINHSRNQSIQEFKNSKNLFVPKNTNERNEKLHFQLMSMKDGQFLKYFRRMQTPLCLTNKKDEKLQDIYLKCTDTRYNQPICDIFQPIITDNNIKRSSQNKRIKEQKFPKNCRKQTNEQHFFDKLQDKVEDIQIISQQQYGGIQQIPPFNDKDQQYEEDVDNDDDEDDLSVKSEECAEQETDKLLLLSSVYENRPSTIFFPYPHQCGEDVVRNSTRTSELTEYAEKKFSLKFKKNTNKLNRCIANAFKCAGIKETEDNDWNIFWGTGRENKVKNMNRFQKVNHFPQCWNMGRKDCLWNNLSKVKRKYPQEYDFIPATYILQHQSDWDRFLAKKQDAEKDKLWIMKPSNQSQGRNIKMISKRSKVQRKQEYIICEYVANPHLIDGLKYDLRVYVLVTSYDPLRIYIFNDGLTRFATEKYTTSAKELSQQYVHLTNYSLNKNNPKFKKNLEATSDNIGSKWSLQALFRQYREMGVDAGKIWDQIKDIVIKTCIATEPYMTDQYVKCESHRTNCFELYGFDILVDSNLKPWLLEVNVRPSLSSSSPLDRKIKHTLICDVFNLIGIQPFDKKKFDDDQRKKTSTVQEQKRSSSKFMKDVSDLNENNCFEKLSPEDWNVLFETDEENYRTGNFERIFPASKDKIDFYLKFFEYERYNNLILRNWIKSNNNFLERILKKLCTQNV